MFERIPLNVYLDHTILKFILQQEIQLSDIYYFDKQVIYKQFYYFIIFFLIFFYKKKLYNSWDYILKNEFSEDDFFEVFAIYRTDGFSRQVIELKPNGENI